MPFVKYKTRKVRVSKRSNRITSTEQRRLENMLTRLGWTQLDWHPSTPDNMQSFGYGSYLSGRPPNYTGEIEDYKEDPIIILVDKTSFKDSGKVLIREQLTRPYRFED